MTRLTRTGQGPYDHKATCGKMIETVPHEMAQSALHKVADDGTADRLADDETRTRGGNLSPRSVRVL